MEPCRKFVIVLDMAMELWYRRYLARRKTRELRETDDWSYLHVSVFGKGRQIHLLLCYFFSTNWCQMSMSRKMTNDFRIHIQLRWEVCYEAAGLFFTTNERYTSYVHRIFCLISTYVADCTCFEVEALGVINLIHA
jgi:hypothetical protein